MRPILLSLSAALVVAVAGCTPPGFARLDPFTLSITDLSDQIAVTFVYDQQHGCQTLDADFSVEMNGTPAIGVFPGRSDLPFGTSCTEPWAALRRPDGYDQTATITASAGGDALTVEIEDMGQRLGAHPVLAPGEVVHVGQMVQLALDPGWDRVQWGDIAAVSVQQGQAVSWEHVPLSPPAAGVMEVQLPSSLPPGPTHVGISVNGPRPTIARCDGPSSCLVPSSVTVFFDVVVDTVP
jgi:hypothetical protein